MYAIARTVFLYLAAGLLGVCALVMAWPRTQASLTYLPVERKLEAYWRGEPLDAAQLEGLRQRTQQALQIQHHPRFLNSLSLLQYIEALDPSLPLYRQRNAFEQSVEQARQSLALAPIQPDAWLRVAHAENWLSFGPSRPVDAFKMSVLTSRVEPQLLVSRLMLGMSRLEALDAESQGLLRDQALLAWRLRKSEFVRAIRNGELSRARLEYLLAGTHPDVLAELEQTLGPVG